MDRMISKKKAISYFCIALAIAIFALIWPLKLIRVEYTAKSNEIMVRESDPISVEYNMAQMFDGIGGELKSVDLFVCNDMSGQIITFRMYNADHEQIFERFVNVDETFIAPGFVNIPVRFDMEQGKEYSFIIEGLTTDLYAAYEDRNTTTSPVNYFMAYGGAEVPEYDLIVRYNYSKPFTVWQMTVTAVILGILCAGIILILRRREDRQIVLRRVFQWTLNPVLVISAILAFYVIMVKRLFGFDTKNNAFLTIGIWMLVCLGIYIVNWGRIKFSESIGKVIEFGSIFHILRIISIATLLWYCYEYMNGLYNIDHYYSISKLVIVFAFLLVFTFSKKEILIIPNAIWLIVGPVLEYLYYKPQIGAGEMQELYRLNGWAIAIGGFVIINLIYSVIRIIKKDVKLPKPNLFFLIPFAVFAIGICVLANGRNWPYLLVAMCILLAFRLAFMEDRARFSEELCAGIVLNFYMMVYFSLRHRPYYFYKYYRYNMGYHTVTMTAYYLAMIVCATWMRLYSAVKKSYDLKDIYGRMFSFGMSVTYLIFTMSRTGFLSVTAMIIFALVLAFSACKKEERLKNTGKNIVIMIIAVLYMFPVTFFLTDIVPRLSNDPIAFEYEVDEYTFKKGMPYSHMNYMTIEQFISEFSKKVLNIDPDKEASIEIHDPFAIRAYAEEIDDAQDTDEEETQEEDVTDMSNGRFDIFKSYIAAWNLWGHEDMEALLPNGDLVVHAHNSFLQVAHDHGIIFGIYFVLFIGYVVILSMIRAVKEKKLS